MIIITTEKKGEKLQALLKTSITKIQLLYQNRDFSLGLALTKEICHPNSCVFRIAYISGKFHFLQYQSVSEKFSCINSSPQCFSSSYSDEESGIRIKLNPLGLQLTSHCRLQLKALLPVTRAERETAQTTRKHFRNYGLNQDALM